jgi:glycosyltransferase involved in cell wall biosynthesis
MKVFYVAAFAQASDHAWFSLGRMRKVGQVLSTLRDLAFQVHILNIAPFVVATIEAGGSPVSLTKLCSTSFLPIRFLQLFANTIFLILSIEPSDSGSILWLYNTRFAESTVALAALLLRPQLRLVLQLEDLASAREANHGLRGALDQFTTSCLSRRANKVFAVSEAVARSFSLTTQFPLESIQILPPALDSLFCMLAAERREPFSTPHYTILYAGSFTREKGVFDLIEAFQSLGPIDAHLILVGSAPDLLRQSHKNQSRIFFTGVISNEELFKLYASCDVVVNPHRKILNPHYVFPFKLVETVSSGALPLTTPVPGSETFGLPADCFIEDIQDLRVKLSHAPQLWRQHRESLQTASTLCRERYSSELIKANIRSALSIL